MHNCTNSKKSKMDTKIEINKRFGMPFFIPLISLICSFLLSSSRDEKNYNYRSPTYFLICFMLLTIAEIGVRYSGISWMHTASYYLLPILLIVLVGWRLWHRDTVLKIGGLLTLYLMIIGVVLGSIHQRNYLQYGSIRIYSRNKRL